MTTRNSAEIATATNVGDTTEPNPVWRQFNWEIYTRNPDTGERGWEIKFRNVTATSKRHAYRLLDESELFDVAILYNGSVPSPIEEERIWDTPETALEKGWYHTPPDEEKAHAHLELIEKREMLKGDGITQLISDKLGIDIEMPPHLSRSEAAKLSDDFENIIFHSINKKIEKLIKEVEA